MLNILCLFIEKAERLSVEARFMLKTMANGNWTWGGLATDTAEDLSRLKATVDELVAYLEWVWNHVDLKAEPSTDLGELIAELEQYQTILGTAIAEGGTGYQLL